MEGTEYLVSLKTKDYNVVFNNDKLTGASEYLTL